MLGQLLSIALIVLFGAMLLGPDFAIVTKNSFIFSRRSGYFTALGIGSAISVQMTDCTFGLSVIFKNSFVIFNLIKYLGSLYLIYLGINLLYSTRSNEFVFVNSEVTHQDLTPFSSFRQGFFTNLLNPKATLFFYLCLPS